MQTCVGRALFKNYSIKLLHLTHQSMFYLKSSQRHFKLKRPDINLINSTLVSVVSSLDSLTYFDQSHLLINRWFHKKVRSIPTWAFVRTCDLIIKSKSQCESKYFWRNIEGIYCQLNAEEYRVIWLLLRNQNIFFMFKISTNAQIQNWICVLNTIRATTSTEDMIVLVQWEPDSKMTEDPVLVLYTK